MLPVLFCWETRAALTELPLILIHLYIWKNKKHWGNETNNYCLLRPLQWHSRSLFPHWEASNAKLIKKVHTLFLFLEKCSFSYFPLTWFSRAAFISPRLKLGEEKKKNTTQWSEIRKARIALHSQPGGIECHLCFIIYGEAMHSFKRLVLSPCCWELCTACSGAAMLHCPPNQRFSHSRAPFSNTTCQGLFWWHHHCCHSRCVPTPLGEAVSWTAAHACPLAQRWSVRRYKSLQCCSAAADYSWWLHLNHIQFNFLLSPCCHGYATLAVKYSTSGCVFEHRHSHKAGKREHTHICTKVCLCTINKKPMLHAEHYFIIGKTLTYQWIHAGWAIWFLFNKYTFISRNVLPYSI